MIAVSFHILLGVKIFLENQELIFKTRSQFQMSEEIYQRCLDYIAQFVQMSNL